MFLACTKHFINHGQILFNNSISFYLFYKEKYKVQTAKAMEPRWRGHLTPRSWSIATVFIVKIRESKEEWNRQKFITQRVLMPVYDARQVSQKGSQQQKTCLGRYRKQQSRAARWMSGNTGKRLSYHNHHVESSRHLGDSHSSCEIYGWLQLFSLLFMAKGQSLFGYKENIVVYQVNSQNWDSAGESRWAWKVDREGSRD